MLTFPAALKKHYGDMQDMEFTIENGKLYMLQTRNGKRTAQAALKVAVDLVDEGVCTKEQAVMKVEAKQLDALLHPTFDPAALKQLRRSPPACRHRPVQPAARFTSPLMMQPRPTRPESRLFSSVRRPLRRISTAWPYPRAS